ncbi:MerR family transcriptional regulator [Paenibacillus nasutitermitis]|uniref:HTH merR-type domain-containing protein n=1 Tax=Paenibacillus nasutitermitis TaxID=1652958 RepID=A0A917E3N7_9BACL|nr:MerR family transcriptional regulator [Paenibacillus nasutitermitis]GGD98093.1 hypothetical protein GCM10010911_66130 [Paenibacillus nasutitermitis]
MQALKTKEAAVALGVSQTTVKRWVIAFPAFFTKDRLGHYIFSDSDLIRLRYIKERVDLGDSLDRLELSGKEDSDDSSAESCPEESAQQADELINRMKRIEHMLSQKADEVVSMQILQHRKELEALNQVVKQLAESVELLERKLARPPVIEKEIQLPGHHSHRRKRGILRSLFQFW